MPVLLLFSIAFAFVASIALVPVVRWLAHKLAIVDNPDHERKLHRQSIALGGGVAVFAASISSIAATAYFDLHGGESLLLIANRWYILFAAAAAMLLIGLVDDKWTLRGRQKLLLQCLTIVVLVGSGTLVDRISLFGYTFQLGVLAFPLTVLWLLVAINALNLIDGADGVATTAGCIICAGLGFLSVRHGVTIEGVVAFALAGALAGFLIYNRPPASIFLGDAGSMMIGLFVGVLAIWSNVKESTVLASAPVAILAIPLFDSTAAILRRWLTGRSIYIADRAHVHHLLQAKYGSARMLLIVATLCTTTTTLAVFSTLYQQPWLSALGVVIVLALLVVTRSFGHAECRLLVTRASQFALSFTSFPSKYSANTLDRRVLLQGSGQWETVWEPLVEFAKSHDLDKIKIDLNLAWLHEGYHATWQSAQMSAKEFQFSLRIPLFTFRQSDQTQVRIGSLEITAAANDPGVHGRISEFSEKLLDLCPQIDAVVGELEHARQKNYLRSGEPVVAAPLSELGASDDQSRAEYQPEPETASPA